MVGPFRHRSKPARLPFVLLSQILLLFGTLQKAPFCALCEAFATNQYCDLSPETPVVLRGKRGENANTETSKDETWLWEPAEEMDPSDVISSTNTAAEGEMFAVVRMCRCASLSLYPKNQYYCGIEHSHCSVPVYDTDDTEPSCLTLNSCDIFVRSVWPIILIWFLIVIIFILVTKPGRMSLFSILSVFIPCVFRRRLANYVLGVRNATLLFDGTSAARVIERKEPGNLLLKTKVFSDKDVEPNPSCENLDDDSSSPTCLICLGALKDGQTVGDLPCHHYFHKECLRRWLQKHNRCPLCGHAGVAEVIQKER